MKVNNEELLLQMSLVKKIGAFGFMFFLFKGMLWLAVIAYFGVELS